MSALVFRLKAAPEARLDLSVLTRQRLAALGRSEIEKLPIVRCGMPANVGDFFAVGDGSAETIVIEEGSPRLDFVGAGLDAGTLIVEGDVGAFAGRAMTGGRIEIRGDAGPWLASGLAGGTIRVTGCAGAHLGGVRPGDRFGMRGGFVAIGRDLGERAGDRMRRGIVVAGGRCGPCAGSRMMGGTIIAAKGFGADPGVLLRRGTLIGPSVERLLPTFVDCGSHELNFLRLLDRQLAETLGPLAPKVTLGPVRRLAGDMATIGKGEILLGAVAAN